MRDLAEVSALEFGKIKWYRIDRQYGFVIRENGEEIFMHHQSIVFAENGGCDHTRGVCARAVGLIPDEKRITLASAPKIVQNALENQRVTFRIVMTPRGPEARAVKRA